MVKKIKSATVHKLPEDLKKAINSNPSVLEKWKDITPLARNEWICWVVSVKTPEKRKEHIKRVSEDLLNGKRRPCCWIGCIHRKDKPLSSSQKFILSKNKK